MWRYVGEDWGKEGMGKGSEENEERVGCKEDVNRKNKGRRWSERQGQEVRERERAGNQGRVGRTGKRMRLYTSNMSQFSYHQSSLKWLLILFYRFHSGAKQTAERDLSQTETLLPTARTGIWDHWHAMGGQGWGNFLPPHQWDMHPRDCQLPDNLFGTHPLGKALLMSCCSIMDVKTCSNAGRRCKHRCDHW